MNRGDKRKPNWCYLVDVAAPGEKRKQRRKGGFRTKEQAQRALNEVVAALQRDRYIEPSRVTVGEFLQEWLAAIRSTIRPSTLSAYEMNVRIHIAPEVGTVQLQRLTADRLNTAYASMLESGRRDGRGLSPKSVRNAHVVMRKALSDAVRWGRLDRNPAEFADPPRLRQAGSVEMKTWSAKQLRTFLRYVEDDDLAALWRLACSTGMRRGELVGLRREDLDLASARLAVRQTVISVDYEIEFGTPKTARGRRVIALDRATVAALNSHLMRQTEQRLAFAGSYSNHNLVFARPGGDPIHPQLVSDRFDKLVQKSGLSRIRLHDLRHTHATLALQAGVHPKVVSERLGHSTVAFTMDVYSHAIPAMQAEAAETIAALISGG
jgi:integrase